MLEAIPVIYPMLHEGSALCLLLDLKWSQVNRRITRNSEIDVVGTRWETLRAEVENVAAPGESKIVIRIGVSSVLKPSGNRGGAVGDADGTGYRTRR